jgi:rRNA processing protein Krr1/Pno1
VITGTREADVGLANVLLSDVIATGSYVSFKESAGNHPNPIIDPSLSFRDNGTEVMYDDRVERARANSFGNPPPPGPDSLGYFSGNRGLDQVAPSPYSSLLNATTSQREAEMQRERDHYAGVNQNNFEFRSQFPGGPQGMEMSEREREMRMTAARYNGLPPIGNSNLAMTPQQQHLQLLQMTSRYPRLFPSASGGTAPPPGVGPLPPQGANGTYPGQIPGSGMRYPPPPRAPFDPRNGMRERGFDGHDDRLPGGPLDDPSDAMRSESLNRAIERANASTGVILGEMLCPAEKISLIIGTKGSIINEISRKSNTVISIVDDDSRINAANPYGAPNKSHRLIIIRGSDEGVETAKRYISGVIASGPAYLNVEILSPSSYQNMAANMGMTVVGQEPFRGQGPPPGQYGRENMMGQQQSLLRPGLGQGDFDDRYSSAGPPGLAELIDFDREREERSSPSGPPGLTVNNGELSHHPIGSDEERDRLVAQTASPFWGSNGAHSQYGGMDGGRIAPPSQLSFTDLKNAGIMNNIDSGNTAPDPNSRRSMARFQTYLDRTHAQQNQQTAGSQAPSPVQPFAPPRIPPPTGAPDRGGYSRALSEVLDTLTCPLQKIPLLLGHKGATLKRIIDISGADIIINHELPPSVPRILELRGTEVQVNSARDMIENILENESNQVPTLHNDSVASPPAKEDDEKLSTLDSHWMSMNAASFRVDGRSSDRFSDGDAGHSDSKEKEEYEAMYGKFMLEDGPRDPSPARAAPASYYKEAPTVFVDNGNYDEEDSLNSDDEIGDSLSLTQNVNFNSQQLITVVQANLGLLDKVANCTGTTVRLVSKNNLTGSIGSSDSMPNSPLRGPGVKLGGALATHSLDDAELTGSAPSRIASTSSSTSPSLSHVIMVSGLALQEVQSGVSVMRKVLHYLSALSGGTSNFKVITSLLIEHVSWPGDTIKDLTKVRAAAIKDIGTTSGAAVVLIRKFTSSVSKDAKATGSVVIPPPALSISFADVLLKREPSLPVPPPVLAPVPAIITFHHHVILIGSRFRIAAARTLLDKAMNCPEDLLLSTSTSSASSTVPSSVSNGMSMLRIPPPPRRAADTDSRGSDSDNDNSYDSEDDDDSYETGSGDDSNNGYSVSNGKTWNRLDNGESKRDGKRGDEKRERTRRDDDESSNVVCILDCPNDKAGLVIGYKGSAIRTMSAKTRAKIVVTDAIINGGVSKRSVKIFGTRKQVEKARALVERLMEIGTDAFDEDYIPSSASLKGVIVPTKETYITSATCAKQLEKENREKDKDRDGSASYQSVELEFPTDVLRRYLVSKNQEGVCKEIMNRFVVVVTFPNLPTVPLPNETFSIVKLKGSRSQLDRAGVYLKRGVGSFKDKDKDDRSVTESRSDRKKRSTTKDRESDNDDDKSEVRRSKMESEKSERKSELKDREVVLDTTGPWKTLDREREEKKEKDKEEFVSVAVTVPCPASRAGCLIGSKGKCYSLLLADPLSHLMSNMRLCRCVPLPQLN